VGLVGARRRRQGLGPYVARDLAAAGADVPCFLVHRRESLEEAHEVLREVAGIEAQGHLDVERMLEACPLDALAILSPAETHARYLEVAARAGLHVLCEKPFVWGVPDPAGVGAELLARFEAQGLQVWENCQWPWTLPGFEALHPGALDRPPRRFEMELEPMTRGLQSLADALPHALSLLQSLVPGDAARLEDVRFSTRDPAAESLTIRFRYRTVSCSCDATVHLRQRETPPRHAAYALDGRRARRLVSPSDYRLSFADADRSVPIADPLTALVADFVAALSGVPGAAPPPARRIRERMQHLVALATAYAPQEIR
jgi:predicted dehydrogenase